MKILVTKTNKFRNLYQVYGISEGYSFIKLSTEDLKGYRHQGDIMDIPQEKMPALRLQNTTNLEYSSDLDRILSENFDFFIDGIMRFLNEANQIQSSKHILQNTLNLNKPQVIKLLAGRPWGQLSDINKLFPNIKIMFKRTLRREIDTTPDRRYFFKFFQ